MNCGERSASRRRSKALRGAGAALRRARRRADEEARRHEQRPGEIAMVSCALRQSVQDTSQAANGESVSGATPIPTETSETARLRWRSNHDITAEIIGAKKLPAATPTSTP